MILPQFIGIGQQALLLNKTRMPGSFQPSKTKFFLKKAFP